MSIADMLGEPYHNLLEAQVDKSPDEVVITKNNEAFYIVAESDYNNSLKSDGYTIVVNVGE